MHVKQKEKKRKHRSSPEPRHPPEKPPEKQPTSASQVENKEQIPHKNIRKPPPIIIENMINYQQMLNAFADAKIQADCFQNKLLNNSKVKINATEPGTYRAITVLLNSRQIQWHSFEDKQTRDIKVMIKDLHHTTGLVNIFSHINQRGLKANNAANKQKWLSAQQKQQRRAKGLQEVVPLDMFIVSFDRDMDINKIYNLKAVMNATAKIEPLRRK